MVRKLAFSLFFLTLSAVYAIADGDSNYNEYNHRMARISYIQNNLSFAHGDEEWTAASINTPLQPGDRLYAPAQSRAEVQFDDGSALRIGGNTEVTLTRLDDDHIQIRLSVGLATLHDNSALYFEVNTPSAAITAEEKGAYRIEVQDNGGVDVKVRKGRVTVYNQALEKHVRKGEHIIIYNPDGADFEVAQLGPKDEWDQWNERRDAMLASRPRYLPDTAYMGAYDLEGYGRWTSVSDYGECWFPSVAVGWSPYRVGRWIYRPFWGWTWVSYEPWGWLPYHYGRWFYDVRFGWGWYPGPRYSFYFWSPGLVRFSYGPEWVGWCPLGPRDYVSFNLFFGRSYYRSYAAHLSFGFGGGGYYGYNNLYNYRAPNSVVYVNRNTFINNSVTNIYNNSTYAGSRRVTYNTLQMPAHAFTSGTMVRDHQLPFKPTVASFSPNPTATVRAPRPELVNRPVFASPARPLGRSGIRPQDAASGGLTLRPPTNRGTAVSPQAVPSRGTDSFPRPGEARSGGRDARPTGPMPQTSKGVQPNGPGASTVRPARPDATGWPTAPARPADRSGSPVYNRSNPAPPARSVDRPNVTPANPAPANPAPAARPARPDASHWPTAPARAIDRPNAPPAHSAPNASPMPASPRSGDRPNVAPANPAPAARPDASHWPTAPARSIDRPNTPPARSAPNNPSVQPAPRGGERPNGAPREERRQQSSMRDTFNRPSNREVVPAPARSRSAADYTPAPNRSSGEGWFGGRRAEPAASPRYNPPPARETRGSVYGGRAPGFEGYARGGHESSYSAPRYNPPPVHNSAPPVHSAPSYDRGGFGRSSAPSYGVHSSPAPSYGGGHASSGGRSYSGGGGGDHHGGGGDHHGGGGKR